MTENVRKHDRKTTHAKAAATQGHDSLYELEADAIRALAHPKRLLILDILSDGKERNVTELMQVADLTQSNLSQNLAVMRGAGLVAARRDGHLVYYRVTDPRVVKAVGLMRAVMTEQAENYQFLAERAELKKKERVKRASLGASFIVAILGIIGLAAALHPLVNGGSFTDVEHHVQVMMASKDLGALFQNCVTVATQASAPASPASMPA